MAVEPDTQTLGVELNVHVEQFQFPLQSEMAAMSGEPFQQHVLQAFPDEPVAMRTGAAGLPCDGGKGIDAVVQVARQPVQVSHAPVVREKHVTRIHLHETVNRAVHRIGVELDRGGRRKDEFAARGVEFPVRQTEGVAGKKRVAAGIMNAQMMACMARCIQQQQFTSAEIKAHPVFSRHDPFRRDRYDRSETSRRFVRSVDGLHALEQLRRISQMAYTARMHDRACLWQAPHEFTGSARMVEVHMGQDHIVDVVRINVLLRKHRHQAVDRMCSARVDDCHAAVFQQKMNGSKPRPAVAGIDCNDSVSVIGKLWQRHGPGPYVCRRTGCGHDSVDSPVRRALPPDTAHFGRAPARHDGRAAERALQCRPGRLISRREADMAYKARKVDYFAMTIADKPGVAAEILEVLRRARVNLLGFTGFPRGSRGQIDFIPDDSAAFKAVARAAKWELHKRKTGFLIQGNDRPGAVESLLSRLAGAGINVTAIDAVCAGKGRYGALLWVDPQDVRRAATALRAS